MFDTIKFKVEVDEPTFLFCRDNATTQNIKQGTVVFWSYSVTLPSSDRNINIIPHYFKQKEQHQKYILFVEFSIPKRLYNTNVILPTRHQCDVIIHKVAYDLQKYFKTCSKEVAYIDPDPHAHWDTRVSGVAGSVSPEAIDKFFNVPKTVIKQCSFPPLNDWILMKLDIPVMWDYHDLTNATNVLNAISNFGQLFKNTTVYKNRDKFYLKFPEFTARHHDYDEMVASGQDKEANNYRKLCYGYLRFETSIFGKRIQTLFKTTNWYKIEKIPNSYFDRLVSTALDKFFNGSIPKKMTHTEAFEILNNKYGYEVAVKLIGYLDMKQKPKAISKAFLNTIPKMTRYRWNKLLKEADVGYGLDSKIDFPSLNSLYYIKQGTQLNCS